MIFSARRRARKPALQPLRVNRPRVFVLTRNLRRIVVRSVRAEKSGEVIASRRHDREWPILPYRPLASSLFIDIRFELAPPHFAKRVNLPERESRRRLLPSAFIHYVDA
ncbi:MAG: hypothetical protein QM685_13815 [Paraburkholderia sp.]